MPDIKRTRKGRPGPKAQRSALIVARGKSSGRDATVQPKRNTVQRVKKDTTTVLEAGDSVESFLERAKRETETYETARGLEQSRAVFVDPEAQEVVNPLRAQGDALFRSLPVPRRPAWDDSTSKDQLTEKEEHAFLQWRRGIAATEEAERSRREKESLANSASVATPTRKHCAKTGKSVALSSQRTLSIPHTIVRSTTRNKSTSLTSLFLVSRRARRVLACT